MLPKAKLFSLRFLLLDSQVYLSSSENSIVHGVVELEIKKPTAKILGLEVTLHGALEVKSLSTEGPTCIEKKTKPFLSETFKWSEVESLEGNYSYPFEFIVSSQLPESIDALCNSILYSVQACVTYQKIGRKATGEIFTSKIESPLKLVRTAELSFEEKQYLLEEFLLEGTFKQMFNYKLCLPEAKVYADDKLQVEVDINPLMPAFYEKHLYKVKCAKVYLYQKYDNGSSVKRKKFFLKKVDVGHRDLDTNGNLHLSMLVDLKPVQKLIYPSFDNQQQNGITHFNIKHYVKIEVKIEEREYLDLDYSTLDSTYQPAHIDCKSGTLRQETASSSPFAQLLDSPNYDIKNKTLTLTNAVLLLEQAAKLAVVAPPSYSPTAPPLKRKHKERFPPSYESLVC